MTTRFRIDSASIATSNGVVKYEFPSALTVLAGKVGVGKSTLFELIKYGFGGDALLTDVVEKHVTSVTLEVWSAAINGGFFATLNVTPLVPASRTSCGIFGQGSFSMLVPGKRRQFKTK